MTNANRTKANLGRIRLTTGLDIRLQLTDDELKAIHITPHKCRPSGVWRAGREFCLFTYAKATWVGGGWWDIKAPNRKALDLVLARLVGIWNPAPVQQSLPIPAPPTIPASKETVARHMAEMRSMLAAGKRK